MKLLIIGTQNSRIEEAGKIAYSNGANVSYSPTIDEGLEIIRTSHVDLVMIDLDLDIDGLFKKLESEQICIDVVACGLKNDADAAVKAIKAGAKEYIPLPPDNELIAAILEAVTAENNSVIYNDAAMKKVITLADRVANSNASILITGESGTGKEVLAKYIHQKSNRANQNFISVNCAAIPDNLLESELFGHEKGAFTGAISKRVGKFEAADGGTLLLDEISEMEPRLQAKLLRAIQEKEINRVGGKAPVKINIRVLATSNRNIPESIKRGEFREDLYYRLNVFNFDIPSLRERPEDIAVLSEHFAEKYSKENNISIKPIAPETMEKLKAHHWQGNVRELENTLHRLVLLEENDVLSPDSLMFSESAHTVDNDVDNTDLIGRTVADVEKEMIINTLEHCIGNKTHASKILGISIRTLRNKLNQYEYKDE